MTVSTQRKSDEWKKMSHWPEYKSDTKPVNPGSYTEYFDFVPLVAPDGGRLIIDKFIICIQGTITVATGTWDGRDVARLLALVAVEKRDGRLRWSASGYKSRLASIKYNGIEEHQEHASVVVGAAQPISLRLIIPMRKNYTRRPNDFALPADAFKKITLTWNALANAQTTSSLLSAATLIAYILVEWHSENKVEFKVDDLVKSVDFNSATQARTSLSGVLHDLDVCREDTTPGGSLVTAITDARIEDLGTPLLTYGDLQHSYTAKRKVAPSGAGTPGTERFLDPVRLGMLLPVMTADYMTSPWDGKIVDSLKLDISNPGAGGLSIISREVVDKSQTDYNATMQRYAIDPKTVAFAVGDAAGNGVDTRPVTSVSMRKQKVGAWVAPLNKAG